jgi:hypothetical protein
MKSEVFIEALDHLKCAENWTAVNRFSCLAIADAQGINLGTDMTPELTLYRKLYRYNKVGDGTDVHIWSANGCPDQDERVLMLLLAAEIADDGGL